MLILFEAITAHWIDEDWNLQEALLDFRHIEGHHDGENLANEVFEVLDEYEICEKLFCITADAAGNNGTMCRFLSKLLKDNKNLKWDPEYYRIACMNHVINLAVQAFLKSIKGLVVPGTDEEIEFSTESVDQEPDTEGFAMAMWKIRSFTKVRTSHHRCDLNIIEICFYIAFVRLLIDRQSQQAIFVQNVLERCVPFINLHH